MWLKGLSVLNFKNYDEAALEFTSKVNSFTGDNGAGKTNLLDAIHYLSLCKSYFNPVDSQQIRQDQEWFMIQGSFSRDTQTEQVSCSLKRNQKKKFQRNKKVYDRLADHIGKFPLVMISPSDIDLILEGSETRRKFIDNVISQSNSAYLDKVLEYNKLLQQRNRVLKDAGRSQILDLTLLEVLDVRLIALGEEIYASRRSFLQRFIPLFNASYNFLSQQAESVSLAYQSQLEGGDFRSQLQGALAKDRVLERTTVGVHKDDLVFLVHDMPLKKFGSQGQQKSFLIALKLAQYAYLYEVKGFKPLLLLDDIFDKLDHKRITKLMQMVSEDQFGQIFITHTDADALESIFRRIQYPLRMFVIESGKVKQQTDYEPK